MRGKPSPEQHFIFEGKLLEDGQTVAYYNITNDSILHMYFELQEGDSTRLTVLPTKRATRPLCTETNLFSPTTTSRKLNTKHLAFVLLISGFLEEAFC